MKTKISPNKTTVNLRKLVREELLKNRKSFLMFNPPKTKKQLVTENVNITVIKGDDFDDYNEFVQKFINDFPLSYVANIKVSGKATINQIRLIFEVSPKGVNFAPFKVSFYTNFDKEAGGGYNPEPSTYNIESPFINIKNREMEKNIIGKTDIIEYILAIVGFGIISREKN